MLAEALAAPGLLWPLSPIPLPPEPASGARRARQRHAQAVELRAVAERLRAALHMMMGNHYGAAQECPARGRLGRLLEGQALLARRVCSTALGGVCCGSAAAFAPCAGVL